MLRENISLRIQELEEEGYKVKGKRVYKNDVLLTFEEMSDLEEDVLDLMRQKSDYEYEKRNVLQAADALPLECFNGTFYREGYPQTLLEVYKLIEEMNPHMDWGTIKQVRDAATVFKAIDTIPEYMMPDCTPRPAMVDTPNGQMPFRFPKSAYQLMYYYLFEPKKAYIFFIMSDGGKGKSTFTNFLKRLFAKETYAADTKFMNQFTTSFIASSRLTIFSDCTTRYIENSHLLKQISGEDEVQIEAKGQQAYSGKIDSYLLFVGNEPIGYNILDSGMRRRFINLPWVNEITIDDPRWVTYEWSEEEIMEQIQHCLTVGPMDYEEANRNTIRETLLTKTAFYYNVKEFSFYETAEKNTYNLDNFTEYRKLVVKYFSQEEWVDLVGKRHGEENFKDYEKPEKDKSYKDGVFSIR